MKRRRPKRKSELKIAAGYFFNSGFEEVKCYDYALNIINSGFLNRFPEQVLLFISELIGEKNSVSLLQESFPDIVRKYEINSRSFSHSYDDIPQNIMTKFLKTNVQNFLDERIKDISVKSIDIIKRMKILKEIFGFSSIEQEIILFLYLRDVCAPLDSNFGRHGDILELTQYNNFRSYGHIMLGLKKTELLKSMKDEKLIQSQIIDLNDIDDEFGLSSWVMNYLAGLGDANLKHEFFSLENDEPLTIKDFNLPQEEVMVLDTLLKSKQGQNVLFYGEPGTGKTSLAKSLAKKYKKKLYSVKVPESDEQSDYQRAIYATVNQAKTTDVILIDEADGLLSSGYGSFFQFLFPSPKNNSKSWINNFLDTNEKKIIWITNHTDSIDPSTMRRFSFTVEFKKFNNEQRLKVLKYELKKKGLDDYFSKEELNDLCQQFSVNAGGIVNAIKVLSIRKGTKKENALKKLKTVLKNHEKVINHTPVPVSKAKDFNSYSLKALNTTTDLNNVVTMINQYTSLQKKEPMKYNQSFSLLLYGQPGTGKSEFTYYLGSLLSKEILLKRSSDIQSKWVGETEQNIASAFREARDEEKILFFDEADTFLFPRKSANRSYEKSFTNEILTQLENHTGIVIFATNDMDGLDHAALRRFKFKIEFKPLTPEGNILCFKKILQPLLESVEPLSKTEIGMLKDIKNLTPGDYAVVKDQHLFMDRSQITTKMLLTALINEVSYKSNKSQTVGFSSI